PYRPERVETRPGTCGSSLPHFPPLPPTRTGGIREPAPNSSLPARAFFGNNPPISATGPTQSVPAGAAGRGRGAGVWTRAPTPRPGSGGTQAWPALALGGW